MSGARFPDARRRPKGKGLPGSRTVNQTGRRVPQSEKRLWAPFPAGPWQGLGCAAGWEETLAAEIRRQFPGRRTIGPGPGLVLAEGDPALLGHAWVFARAFLPDVILVCEPSVKGLARALGEAADRVLDGSPLPWTLCVQTMAAWAEEDGDHPAAGLAGRARLVAEAFLERMSTFRRRAMERYRAPADLSDRQPCVLVQAALLNREQALVSAAEPVRGPDGRRVPSPRPSGASRPAGGGWVPCRSYFKVEEAWAEGGRGPQPGELCVDLGAAPGGWSWSALQRGARVIAVDAADLEPRVSGHPGCTHLRENGYAYLPPQPADWLLCDMIVRPLATLGLLERWLAAGLCRGFVVNVKFRGKDPSTILEAVEGLRERFSLARLRVRHLRHDRNEITLICPPPDRKGRR